MGKHMSKIKRYRIKIHFILLSSEEGLDKNQKINTRKKTFCYLSNACVPENLWESWISADVKFALRPGSQMMSFLTIVILQSSHLLSGVH